MDELQAFIKKHRPHLEKTIKEALRNYPQVSSDTIEKDVVSSIEGIICEGKMLRGLFVVLGYLLYADTDEVPDEVYEIAAAVEFNHTGILVHDDIIDRDEKRRGKLTVHEFFTQHGKRRNAIDPHHYGISMGISVGDVCLYTAQKLLGEAAVALGKSDLLTHFFNIHYITFIGEFIDIDHSETQREPSIDEIYDMHRWKTGYYTFGLPFILGATVGEAPKSDITVFKEMGEILGLVFQIKDDELGMFGDPKVTGKAVGTDVMYNKKTPLRMHVFNEATSEERSKLHEYYGNTTIGIKEVRYIQDLLKKYKIDNLMHNEVDTFTKEAIKCIQKLSISDEHHKLLESLAHYNATREK